MSDTPARRTRSTSATPLPPLTNRANHSYGAIGKTSLRTQMADQGTSLSGVMASRKTRSASNAPTSVEPEDDMYQDDPAGTPDKSPSIGSKKRAVGRTTRKSKSIASRIEEEDEEEEESIEVSKGPETFLHDTSLPGEATDADPGSSRLGSGRRPPTPFGRKAPPPSAPSTEKAPSPAPKRPSPVKKRMAPVVRPPIIPVQVRPRQPEPNWFQVTARTIPRYVPQVIQNAAANIWNFRANRAANPPDAPEGQPPQRAQPAVARNAPVAEARNAMGYLGLFLTAIIMSLATIGTLYASASLLPLPSSVQPYADDFVIHCKHAFGVSPYERPRDEVEQAWLRFRHDETFRTMVPGHNVPDLQWGINANFLGRIERLEDQLLDLQKTVGLHGETVNMLNEILPNTISVREIDGQWEIPDHFWEALHERLITDDRILAPLWDNFMTLNENKLELLSRSVVSKEIADAMSSQHIISKDMFVEAVEANYKLIQESYGADLRGVEKKLLTEARKVSEFTTSDLIEKSPIARFAKIQSDSLAYSNIIANTKIAMSAVNHFSIGLGARIDMKFTSPTYNKNTWWGTVAYAWLMGERAPYPPLEALNKWDEATECWCATPGPGDMGKAQIAIVMAHKMYPERLVVEHVPHTGTFNIAAAPKDLEVWAETNSASQAKMIQKTIDETVPPSEYRDCGKAPSNRHVCIGKLKYDIHYDNWVQSGAMFVDAEAMGMALNRVTVRVVNNWGNPVTCLYRLRMIGKRVPF